MKMRQNYLPLSLLTITLGLCSTIMVQAQPVEKKINKTFNVNSDTELHIANTFGKVHIDTWDKNQIQAQITIKAESKGGNSQELLDRISIDIDESSSQVSLRTEIENKRNWGKRNQKFEIDYLVKMPKANPLDLTNRHGDIFLDNFDGRLDLDLAHGQLVTEKLSGEVDISVAHGNGGRILSATKGDLEMRHYQRMRIGYLGNMEVDVAHAGFELEKAGNLNLESQHTNFEIDEIKDLRLYLQHGNAELGSVGSLSSDMQHSDIDIEELSQSIEVDGSHSDVRVDRLSSGFKLVDFSGSHSYFGVGLSGNVNCSIEAKLDHGRMRYEKDKVNMSFVSIKDQRAEYRGVMGSNKTPAAKIRVNGSFTDFNLDTE
ncbi:MAG: hypothetical protein ACR2MX_09950 [Cyclobacteriaceae bacterium]